MDPKAFLRMYDQASNSGSMGDGQESEGFDDTRSTDAEFAAQFNRMAGNTNQQNDDAGENEFNQDLLTDDPGRAGGDKGDQNITLPEKDVQVITSVMREAGFKGAAPKTMKDVMGALGAMATFVKQGRAAQSKAGRLQQVVSVLARDPGFADAFANAMNNLDDSGGSAGSGGAARKLPPGLSRYTEQQLAQFRENVEYFMAPYLDGIRREVSGTINSRDTMKDFASKRPDWNHLLPRIKQIARETGFNVTPTALKMAYREAREQAIEEDDYPFDERGKPLGDGGRGGNRQLADDFPENEEFIDDEPEPGRFQTRPRRVRNFRASLNPGGRGAGSRNPGRNFRDLNYDPNRPDDFEAAANQEFDSLMGALFNNRGGRGR